ncbi:MAG: DNA mismatch endonuclease Vsr [Mesorhizobium sp.]|uniref:very short patch repair endonuclease n=1 Tax=Mesorhizobium sp. TaxID=1871066 RepID=UPI0011F4CD81|nr:very short patch repair endonuclease [Mesorhizobium sp.]TIR14705.1 MAG: DNA mismatch endonuclease Vsr [Mesorhizobium sp.]
MVDQLTAHQRSAFMANIRSRHTRPELVVRRLLHGMGYRYRLHHKKLPGRPDIVFVKRRKVIFVHGCFWHNHEGCSFAHVPKTRPDYWQAKFEYNRSRDKLNRAQLESEGWKVLVIWECDINERALLATRVRAFLDL